MPYSLRKKKGSPYWYFRGTIPSRQADGSIVRVRHEESLGTESKTKARKLADERWDYYHALAYGKIADSGPTFAQAAITYLQTRGKPDRFLDRLVQHFGETPIKQIDQAAVADAAHRLYPGACASTHNRAVFAPIITVLRLAGRRVDFQRPRIDRKAVATPPEGWFDTLLPHCPPRLRGLLVFLTLTGRRITEALEAIDNGDGTCTIGRTKTGQPVVLAIPAHVRSLVGGGKQGERLFPYGDRHNVYRELRKACNRAGVPYYGTHALGRHAFATRLLKAGYSLKFVQEAGGWATIKMPAMHYAHLEKSEVQAEVLKVGQEWGKRFDREGEKGENPSGSE